MSTVKCFICDTDVYDSRSGVARVGEKGDRKFKKVQYSKTGLNVSAVGKYPISESTHAVKNISDPVALNATLKT